MKMLFNAYMTKLNQKLTIVPYLYYQYALDSDDKYSQVYYLSISTLTAATIKLVLDILKNGSSLTHSTLPLHEYLKTMIVVSVMLALAVTALFYVVKKSSRSRSEL